MVSRTIKIYTQLVSKKQPFKKFKRLMIIVNHAQFYA